MSFKNIIIIFVSVFVLVLAGAAWIGWYFLYTEKGAQWIVDKAIEQSSIPASIKYGRLSGQLNRGIEINNLEINPLLQDSGGLLRIQDLKISGPVWRFPNIQVTITNLRLILPEADPIVLDGKISDQDIELNLFAKTIDIETVRQFIDNPELNKIQAGRIANVEIKVSGAVQHPKVQGILEIVKLKNENFDLMDSPATLDLELKKIKEVWQPVGLLTLGSGKLIVKNITLNLDSSKFNILGNIEATTFNILASTKIEDVEVNIELTGTKSTPNLKLRSDPSLPEDRLFLMLATGKKWSGLDQSFDKKQVSPDLVKDLIDYFLFSNSGDKLASQLGIKSVYLTVEKDKKGIGVRKQLTNNLDVGYEINETQATPEQKKRDQKISGALKVSDTVTVSAEKELRIRDNNLHLDEQEPENTKFLMEYKKSF